MRLSRAQILSRFNIPREGRFVVAFSGGMDSLALVLLLTPEERRRSYAVYVDHAIRSRGELDKEISLNRQNAETLGIPFEMIALGEGSVEAKSKEKNCGTEAAARALRYEALERFRASHSLDYILTAHHLDDQAETLIMQMKSSSPIWVYSGIREREGRILRPMLNISKDEIRDIVLSSGLEWSEDSTNEDQSYKRNWIRKNLLPKLSKNEKLLLSSIARNTASLPGKPIEVTAYGRVRASISRKEFLSSFPWDREKAVFKALSILGNKERIKRGLIREIESGADRGSGRTEYGSYQIRYLSSSIEFYSIPEEFSSQYDGEDTILPLGIRLSTTKGNHLTLEIPPSFLEGSIFRLCSQEDSIELKDGRRKVSSMLKDHHLPYAFVLEKDGAIIAFFSAFLGGRDRLNAVLRGQKGGKISLNP